MRIRKLASKVLGTPSSQQHSSPPPPATYSFGMMHAYACVVNRSRWDVFPFTPLGEASDDDNPLPEEVVEEQESSMTDDVIKEEYQPMSAITRKRACHPLNNDMKRVRGIERPLTAPASAWSFIQTSCLLGSHSSSSTAQIKLKEEEPAATGHESEAMYEEMYIERKPKKMKPNKGRKTTTRISRAAAADAKQEEYIESTTYTCKKTDGKQWRCKLPVDQPNSLCHYHLDQLFSYRCSTNSTRKAKRVSPARKTTASSCNRTWRKRPRIPAVATSGGSDSNDMYYYSAFGPWRGKERGGEPETVAQGVKEENEEQQLEWHRSSRGNDDDEDDEVASDEDSLEEDSEEERRTEKQSSRKKKRRPVKARSLKSLL